MSGMGEPLTEDEKQTLKTAAFGAVYLVSNADPGFFNALRESFAASAAIAGTAGLVREALTAGPLPRLPKAPPAHTAGVGAGQSGTAGVGAGQSDTAEVVLAALRRSVAILAEKAPEELENYQATVVDAVDRVAQAADGVSEPEYAMIARVKEALTR
jgi:hypothetical protein